MYYVYSYARLDFMFDDDEKVDRLWAKIVSEGHGRYVSDEYYIFSTEETIEIEGIKIEPSYQLKEWVSTLCCDGYTEIYEGFNLEHSEVMELFLDELEDDTLTDNEEYPTYADMIFHAEDPRTKAYELLVETADIVLDIKMQEMKEAFEKFSKGLKDRTIMLH